jgi:predicted RNase H-like nuclease (RuvC/YqgF family)
MSVIQRWASPEDAMPWSIAGLSVAIVGVVGVYFALRRKDARAMPYLAGILRSSIPIIAALVAVNVAIAFELSRAPAANEEGQLREQVERLSAERKGLMKALFAAGKYETQAGALQAQLREREASIVALEGERTRLREELETLKGKLAVAETRSATEKESAQLRVELEAKAQRLALLESTQRETRQELLAIREDLRRGRRVTDARLVKVLATIPSEESPPSR